jgi:hypothetical protein
VNPCPHYPHCINCSRWEEVGPHQRHRGHGRAWASPPRARLHVATTPLGQQGCGVVGLAHFYARLAFLLSSPLYAF